ncbi:MAG: redoxin family protein [Verrucomicrobiota bacterium]
MRKPRGNTAVVLAILAAALVARPGSLAAGLAPGDPAPSLKPGRWIQGQPVPGFDSNHVYVLTFFATWSAPCRQSLLHLQNLASPLQNRGLVAAGLDVWEPDDTAVPAFLTNPPPRITLPVALDDKSGGGKGALTETWLNAAGQDGIPTTFIVDQKGRIAWIGHPLALNASLLESILAGTFQTDAYAQAMRQREAEKARRDECTASLQTALRQTNWQAADQALTELELLAPEPKPPGYGILRLQILLGQKNAAAALRQAESLTDQYSKSFVYLNEIAWVIASARNPSPEILAAAEKSARRACELADGKSPGVLDTLARVQFLLGKTREAIATQQQAVDAARNDAEKSALRQTLDSYRKGQKP